MKFLSLKKNIQIEDVLYETSPRLYFLIKNVSIILVAIILFIILLPNKFEELNFVYFIVLGFLLLLIIGSLYGLLITQNLIITPEKIILNQKFSGKRIYITIDDIEEIFYNDDVISSFIGRIGFSREMYEYTNYRTTLVLKNAERLRLNNIMKKDFENFIFYYHQLKIGNRNLEYKKRSSKEYWDDNQDGLKSLYLNAFIMFVIYLLYLCFS